jgi:hypothetical protein
VTVTEPHLSVVAADERPALRVPTPADIRRQQIADELLGVLEDAADRDRSAAATVNLVERDRAAFARSSAIPGAPATDADALPVVEIPVLDVPMRKDRPRPSETFTARVVDEDRGGAIHLVHGVTHWRIHDGALALYGEQDGRPVKLQTINAFCWTRVERLAGGAA